MLISVHLPKTAGSSFKRSLQEGYGKKLYLDYDDSKFIIQKKGITSLKHNLSSFTMSSFKNYSNYDCIHGHFLPIKYKRLSIGNTVDFITWMRDPVDRLFSHYYFIHRSHVKGVTGPFWDRVVNENWSVEKFVFSTEVRNLYSKYLWLFSINKFDFIGITEFYDDDMNYFMDKYLGHRVETFKENMHKKADSGYNVNDSLRAKIEKYHDKDVALYIEALKLRKKRI